LEENFCEKDTIFDIQFSVQFYNNEDLFLSCTFQPLNQKSSENFANTFLKMSQISTNIAVSEKDQVTRSDKDADSDPKRSVKSDPDLDPDPKLPAR